MVFTRRELLQRRQVSMTEKSTGKISTQIQLSSPFTLAEFTYLIFVKRRGWEKRRKNRFTTVNNSPGILLEAEYHQYYNNITSIDYASAANQHGNGFEQTEGAIFKSEVLDSEEVVAFQFTSHSKFTCVYGYFCCILIVTSLP